MRKYEIIPSIASANQLYIAEEIKRVKDYKRLHIDIEDGNFVPNITFGVKMLQSIAEISSHELDVHILANNPERYIELLKESKIKNAAIHYEAVSYPLKVLNKISVYNMRPGLALNFSTAAEVVIPFMDSIAYVLIMTSEPDGAGENFRPAALGKIEKLRRLLPENVEIWVDGGIGESQLQSVVGKGADKVVMGRAVFDRPAIVL